MATLGHVKLALITGGLYYLEFIHSEKYVSLYKSGHNNGLDILYYPWIKRDLL